VILVDANLLVYAAHDETPSHAMARGWLEERLGGTEPVGLPWVALLAFARLSCMPTVLERPLTPGAAWAAVTDWLAQPPAWVPEATPRHADIVGRLLERETRADLVPDAHLAALAIEHGLTLCSADRDFGRFEGLRWENPVAG
jgi:toxin-antitoxin system PIN domain toxin